MAHTYVLFGASGDLTRRKLIPALYRSFRKDRLPPDTRVVGMARSELDDESFRDRLAGFAGDILGDDFDADAWNDFAERIHYRPGDVTELADVEALSAHLDELDGGDAHRILYLATSPSLYESALENLGRAGLASENGDGSRRVVVEKPFGTDLASARSLNDVVHRSFEEHQVYRIDHYLGKETVQNLLVLRFANSIFEPVWNRNYIDHVQITVAEEDLVGTRGPYYDEAGVLRLSLIHI